MSAEEPKQNGHTPQQNLETHCSFCKQQSMTKKCSNCLSVAYCGRECQQKHWATHRLECSELSQKRKEEQNKQDKLNKETQDQTPTAPEQPTQPQNSDPRPSSHQHHQPGKLLHLSFRVWKASGDIDQMDQNITVLDSMVWNNFHTRLCAEFHIHPTDLRIWIQVPKDYTPKENEKSCYSGPFRFKLGDSESGKTLEEEGLNLMNSRLMLEQKTRTGEWAKDKADAPLDISNLDLNSPDESPAASPPRDLQGFLQMMAMGGMGRMKTRQQMEEEEMKKVLRASLRDEQQRQEKERKEKEEKERIEKEQEEIRNFAKTEELRKSQTAFAHAEDDDEDLETLMKKHANDSEEEEEEEEYEEVEEEE